jgi:hypothetical protein
VNDLAPSPLRIFNSHASLDLSLLFISYDLAEDAAHSGLQSSMSSSNPTIPRRGTQRASHLRQVSNGSSEYVKSRPLSVLSETGIVNHDPVPPKSMANRRCNIWVHDESFSRDEVVINLDLFPDVKAGELMAIVALKTDSGVRDFVDKAQISNGEPTVLVEQSHLNPNSPVPVYGSEGNHDVDHGKKYLFIAKDMPKEIKTRQPNLEISVAKNVADVFNLKHRSNVLVTSVSSPCGICLAIADVPFRPMLQLAPPLTLNYASRTNT